MFPQIHLFIFGLLADQPMILASAFGPSPPVWPPSPVLAFAHKSVCKTSMAQTGHTMTSRWHNIPFGNGCHRRHIWSSFDGLQNWWIMGKSVIKFNYLIFKLFCLFCCWLTCLLLDHQSVLQIVDCFTTNCTWLHNNFLGCAEFCAGHFIVKLNESEFYYFEMK